MTPTEQIRSHHWLATVEQAVQRGERFAGAWASEREGCTSWRALFISAAGPRVLCTDLPDAAVASIVDLDPGGELGRA